MRDANINVFYYPDHLVAESTLKKAILMFDELHFMDRPSIMFEGGLGTIGDASPLRQFEKSFQEAGVPGAGYRAHFSNYPGQRRMFPKSTP